MIWLYVIAYFVIGIIVGGYVHYRVASNNPQAEQYGYGFSKELAALSFMFWPMALPIVLITRGMGYVSATWTNRDKEAERRAEAQRESIKEAKELLRKEGFDMALLEDWK